MVPTRRPAHASAPAGSRVRATQHALPDGLVELPGIPLVDPGDLVIADPRSSNALLPMLQAGELLSGQYEVVGPMARGGMGWIHLARDRAVADRWVVLKSIQDPGDHHAVAAAIAEREFLAEVEHPNIVKIYNFVEHRGAGYIVMEFVSGISLRRMLDTRRDANGGQDDPLPVPQAIAYVLDALLALAHLHRLGLVFCDFKPDNVIVTSDTVKLVDLGGVWRRGAPVDAVYGTIGYQAPELARLGPSVASDVFTVGRTLAALCLDIPGFDQEHRYVLPGRSDVPLLARWPSFDQLLRRATALEPEERFGSVEDLAGQLGGVAHEIVAAERGRPAPRVERVVHRRAARCGEGRADHGRRSRRRSSTRVIQPRGSSPRWGVLARVSWSASWQVRSCARRRSSCGWRAHCWSRATSSRPIRCSTRGSQPIPTTGAAAWYRGIGALVADDTRTAGRHFASVYHDLPGELAPKLALGHVAFAAGRWQDAARWYDVVSRTDDAFTTASIGLARCCLEGDDLDGAVAAYDRVPQTSTAWVAAQIGKARALTASSERTEDAARLVSAGAILDGLTLEAIRHHRLAVEVLTVGLHLTSSASAAAPTEATVLGRPLTESGMRAGLETSYRALARHTATRAERIALVDRANQVRPRTLL